MCWRCSVPYPPPHTIMEEARALFRDASTTEFIIVAIPTIMALAESSRLAAALHKEHVPVHTIVVNQVIGGGVNMHQVIGGEGSTCAR